MAMMRIAVLLPAPLGPKRAKMAPRPDSETQPIERPHSPWVLFDQLPASIIASSESPDTWPSSALPMSPGGRLSDAGDTPISLPAWRDEVTGYLLYLHALLGGYT